MGIKHKESSRKRWENTGPEERARLGAIHKEEMKKYWSAVSVQERSRRAKRAAEGRWGTKV